jgi:hypothetical protein
VNTHELVGVVVDTSLAWTVCIVATRHCCKQAPHQHCWGDSVVVFDPFFALRRLSVGAVPPVFHLQKVLLVPRET